MMTQPAAISEHGLQQFTALRSEAIDAVTAHFYHDNTSIYARFGDRGREACRTDIEFHLEFLRPALEFGLLQPMVEYLRWLAGVLATRDVPTEHLPQSLDWLTEFFEVRMDSPDSAIVSATLQSAKIGFLNSVDSLPAIYTKMPSAWGECSNFAAALLAGDRDLAAEMLDKNLAAGRSLVEFELHMIQPALYDIGRKWQENKVSVAQEHLATVMAQSIMVRGLVRTTLPPANGKKVLLACVQGNSHAVGLHMVGDAFLMAGWEVNLLGANVPTASLVRHAGDWKPDLLGLSVAFPDQFRAVKEVMARLTMLLGDKRPSTIIGGLAINNFDRLAGRFGADGWSSDASAAVVSGTQLVARRSGT